MRARVEANSQRRREKFFEGKLAESQRRGGGRGRGGGRAPMEYPRT